MSWFDSSMADIEVSERRSLCDETKQRRGVKKNWRRRVFIVPDINKVPACHSSASKKMSSSSLSTLVSSSRHILDKRGDEKDGRASWS